MTNLQTDKSSLETQVSSLETENNQLQIWLDGNITNYESQLTTKNAQILDLEDENDELRLQYNTLNTTYTWLKQHSFTYYTVGDDSIISVGDDIRISNVGIYEVGGPIGWIISGTITNIGNKPIGPIYVYRVLRNPDGTADFSTYDYVEVLHLFVGETRLFTFPSIDYDEIQTIEVFLVY